MEKAQAKLKLYCQDHPNFQFEFLQINNLSANKSGQKLFYCSECVFSDLEFKYSNYSLINHIVKTGDDQLIQNWPPLNDNQIIKQLKEISIGQEEILQIETRIDEYFTDLKQDILKQIDICQKKMFKQAQELIWNKTDILNKYQELSKIKELQSILTDNTTDIDEKEKKYRALVENILEEKKRISEQLESLLCQYQMQQPIFNTESAFEIKESILKSISSIDMLERNIDQKKLDVELFTTDFRDGNECSEIIKNQNNQYEIHVKKLSEDWFNTVSNLIMDYQIKYIFRIEIKMINEGDTCCIGFMQNKNSHTQLGCFDYLSCSLIYQDKTIYQNSRFGIDKLIKGNEFKLSKENVIEIRMCIEDQILEVLDYPNYQCKLALLDQYKSNLINHQDLRLSLSMWGLNNQMILKEAFTVNKFE